MHGSPRTHTSMGSGTCNKVDSMSGIWLCLAVGGWNVVGGGWWRTVCVLGSWWMDPPLRGRWDLKGDREMEALRERAGTAQRSVRRLMERPWGSSERHKAHRRGVKQTRRGGGSQAAGAGAETACLICFTPPCSLNMIKWCQRTRSRFMRNYWMIFF